MTRRARFRRRVRRRGGHRGAGLNLVSLMDIFTILVFFLLVTASNMEELPNRHSVDLPVATAQQPPEEGLTLYVTDTAIMLGERTIVTVAEALQHEGPALPVLYQAFRQPANATRPELGYRLTILADRETPYRLLSRILATCAQAEFSSVALAVEQVTNPQEAS